jgi:hypothetical protein
MESPTVENYLNDSYCGCVFKRNNDIADVWLTKLPVLIIHYDVASFDENYLGCIDSGCTTFFIMSDVFQEFHDSFMGTHDKADQRVAEKYVLIISDKAEMPQYRLDFLVIQGQLFRSNFRNKDSMASFFPEIPNLLYLSNKDDETFDLYAFDGGLELILKDSFDVATERFLLNSDLYPSFNHHLNGRSIRVGAIFYLPNAYYRTVVRLNTFN